MYKNAVLIYSLHQGLCHQQRECAGETTGTFPGLPSSWQHALSPVSEDASMCIPPRGGTDSQSNESQTLLRALVLHQGPFPPKGTSGDI